MTVTAVAPLTHLPSPPSSQQVSVARHVVAPSQSKLIATPSPGVRSLNIGNGVVLIDPTQHTPQNVVDLINGSRIPGIVASLDRYGQLVITGVNAVTGDAVLLQHLGLTL